MSDKLLRNISQRLSPGKMQVESMEILLTGGAWGFANSFGKILGIAVIYQAKMLHWR